jgi:undecaprenyl diphosphate synthase
MLYLRCAAQVAFRVYERNAVKKPIDEIFPNPPEDLDPHALIEERVPKHVAVIMDGNGRWAKKRLLNRLNGHKAGVEAVRELIRAANDVGVECLTIYSFSTENWKRPEEEVTGLMDLFAKTMLAEVDGLHEEHVVVCPMGDLSALPQDTQDAFMGAWEKTKDNDGMKLFVAVNYGSRKEICDAVNEIVMEAIEQHEETYTVPLVTEELLSKHLYVSGIPDPDLLIRTSGEMRLSNFLLWQIAYSEFYCTDTLWPDFDRYEFLRALLDYQSRNRRFGAVS